MNEEIKARIKELRKELESGKQIMSELETKRVNITYALVRISGAIQVLDEMLSKEQKSDLPNEA